MTCWTAAQLAAFLAWASEHSHNYPLWHSLAMTGERRGEWLAARWRDLDMETGAARVRRSAGLVRVAGEGAETIEGDTKSSKPRVVDVDHATVAIWRAHRKARGSMALQLARDGALAFGDIEGRHRNPEHVSRQFARDVARCREALGEDAMPKIRLHDLRHTHATILQGRGVASDASLPGKREDGAVREPEPCLPTAVCSAWRETAGQHGRVRTGLRQTARCCISFCNAA